MLALVIAMTIIGPVWPQFVWFRPITIGLVTTTAFAVAWLIAVLALATIRGWKYLWFLVAAPLLLYFPLLYEIMISCMATNSCP